MGMERTERHRMPPTGGTTTGKDMLIQQRDERKRERQVCGDTAEPGGQCRARPATPEHLYARVPITQVSCGLGSSLLCALTSSICKPSSPGEGWDLVIPVHEWAASSAEEPQSDPGAHEASGDNQRDFPLGTPPPQLRGGPRTLRARQACSPPPPAGSPHPGRTSPARALPGRPALSPIARSQRRPTPPAPRPRRPLDHTQRSLPAPQFLSRTAPLPWAPAVPGGRAAPPRPRRASRWGVERRERPEESARGAHVAGPRRPCGRESRRGEPPPPEGSRPWPAGFLVARPLLVLTQPAAESAPAPPPAASPSASAHDSAGAEPCAGARVFRRPPLPRRPLPVCALSLVSPTRGLSVSPLGCPAGRSLVPCRPETTL
ncbi:basic proline-rich protein-like [Hyaena hyaena]|uniref:basic proline-rich protein-like n=1 Tax=Hyaena hyaena TaxID=95912 RepID=UPI001922245F|nr:basic proline-rich protein-like [Hyaena hyaena]